jgi:hypothetical protein
MTETIRPDVSLEGRHAAYCSLAAMLPKLSVGDPRVLKILEAKAAKNDAAELEATREFGPYLNNFGWIFDGWKDDKHGLNTGAADSYRHSSFITNPLWLSFLGDNPELLDEIDVALAAQEPADRLWDYYVGIWRSRDMPWEEKHRLAASLDEATGHPLGVSSITYYFQGDVVNPLLREAHQKMEAVGIDWHQRTS